MREEREKWCRCYKSSERASLMTFVDFYHEGKYNLVGPILNLRLPYQNTGWLNSPLTDKLACHRMMDGGELM